MELSQVLKMAKVMKTVIVLIGVSVSGFVLEHFLSDIINSLL